MKPTTAFARNLAKEEEISRILANKGLQNIAVFAYDLTDSTNTRAKLFAERSVAGVTPAIFISRAQSAGRGTRARAFESPVGGLYMSILLPKSTLNGNPQSLTSYCAVIAARACEAATGGKVSPKIKWVNDLVVSDRKLGGILTESAFTDSGERFFIVGIGINLFPAPHSEPVLGLMTTLCDEGASISDTELLSYITAEFFSSLDTFDSDSVTREYVERSSLIGREVEISGTEHSGFATVHSIDYDRAILLKFSDGSIKRYYSGDVSIRPKGD